jgi:hypothetical protein
MRTWHFFDSADDAELYRSMTGSGGWIYASNDKGDAILFSPDMTPTDIFNCPLISSQGGRLIGCKGNTIREVYP